MVPRLIEAVLGIWLIAAPGVLGYGGTAADGHRVVGPVVASVAIVAVWETTRGVRWANLVLGAWLLLSTVVIGGTNAAVMNSAAVGVALMALPLLGGRTAGEYGGGWRVLIGRRRDAAATPKEE